MERIAGRDAERAAIAGLAATPAAGLTALVLEGEAGIGKTTLWRHAVDLLAARGDTVLTARPARAEHRLSFAVLGDLLEPVPQDLVAALPEPQRAVLEVALLRRPAGRRLDAHTLGRALVSLIAALTAHERLVIAVDDVQWADPASVRILAFALRRVPDRAVTVIAGRRTGEAYADPLAELARDRVRRMRLGPLRRDAVMTLIRERAHERPSRAQMERIATVSAGNPLHAVEMVRRLDDPTAAADDGLERMLTARVRRLPAATRAALLQASAMATPTLTTLDRDALAAAEAADVVAIDPHGRVTFTHPLLGEAVYAAAPPAERRRMHALLADALDDPEEVARHLAAATEGPDAAVAAALDAAAAHAADRGAPGIAAEHAEAAARRTPAHDADARQKRLLRAGRHHLAVGDMDRAVALAEEVAVATAAGPRFARARYVQAQALLLNSPAAPLPRLVDALQNAGDDADLCARIELALGMTLISAGRPGESHGHLDRAAALAERTGAAGTLAEALAYQQAVGLFTGSAFDAAELDRALSMEDRDREPSHVLPVSLVVASVHLFSGRLEAADAILTEYLSWASDRGEETLVAWIHIYQALRALLAGELDAAWAHADDGARAAEFAGLLVHQPWARTLQAMVAIIRGDAETGRRLATSSLEESARIRWPDGDRQARWALALLALTQDDPATAWTTLADDVARIEAIGAFEWPAAFFVPEAVEALVGIGEHARAAALAEGLMATGAGRDRPWAVATGARGAALVAAARGDLTAALDLTAQALEAHERLGMPFERARALLMRGQVERRLKRRTAARQTLEEAQREFTRIGAAGFAARADAEAQRLGRRSTPGALSATERQVARLAAQGLTNAEIATRLFLTARTVESNLTRAYAKLGVRSRAQLAARGVVLDDADAPGP